MELTIDQALIHGEKAHKEGHFEEAERLYRAILEAIPTHAAANHNMGLLAIMRQQPNEALVFFKGALEKDPSTEQFWTSLIECFVELEMIDNATELFVKAAQSDIVPHLQHRVYAKLNQIGDLTHNSSSSQFHTDKTDLGQLAPAIEMRDTGMYKDGQAWLRSILERRPDHVEAISLLSNLLILDEKLHEADKQLSRAMSLNPNIASVHLNRARLLMADSRPEEALKEAKVGYQLSQGSLEGCSVFAACLRANNVPQEAQKYVNKALEISPDYPDALITRSLIKYASRDITGAILDAKLIVSKKPHLAKIWFLLGTLHNEQDSVTEAIAALEKAHDLVPEEAKYLVTLGRVHLKASALTEAINLFRRATQIAGSDAKTWTDLGVALQKNKQFDDARSAYERALNIEPGSASILCNLGAMARAEGKYDEALTYLRRAVEIAPNEAQTQSNLGIVLFEMGDLEKAESATRSAISLQPNSAINHTNLGNILRKLDRLPEAEQSYRIAIKVNSKAAQAYTNLGATLRQLGKLTDAVIIYEQGINENPEHAQLHYNLGITLKKSGRFYEAETSFRAAIAIRPDYVEAINNRGIVLQEMCLLEDAVKSYTEAIKLVPTYEDALWNLIGTSSSVTDALGYVENCLRANAHHVHATLMRAALMYYKGDPQNYNALLNSDIAEHPYMRSFKWVFSLPSLPALFFDRWEFFDAVAKKTNVNRPFYEFGVWTASSFKYLLSKYTRGYGFDTFTGLPEDWYFGDLVAKSAGSYSGHGEIPQLEGAEFIVGRFEDTLPSFFSVKRPTASLINFDADLYSSTLCALEHSKPIISGDSILVFDEFLMNASWENDEFRALAEFCSNNRLSFEVEAISFFTKQVAVKLVGL